MVKFNHMARVVPRHFVLILQFGFQILKVFFAEIIYVIYQTYNVDRIPNLICHIKIIWLNQEQSLHSFQLRKSNPC